MCFSASASFTASAFLSLIGLTTLWRIRFDRRLLPAASIPLIFGIQQAAEGMVWLGIYNNRPDLITFFSYIFLGIAMICWPLIVPYAVYALEKNQKRKQLLRYLLFVGLVIAVTLVGTLLMVPIRVIIQHHHIVYEIAMSDGWIWLATILYIIATLVPLFVSTQQYARLFGIILAVSYGISYIQFSYAHISIWCFIAAILSVLILLLLNDNPTSLKLRRTNGRSCSP